MIERLDELIAQRFRGQIVQPQQVRLGNPTLAETVDRINVTDVDQPGMVWIHGVQGEPSGVAMALNAGPGKLAERDKVYGDYVLVRKRTDGSYVVAGRGYEDHAEYMAGVVLPDVVSVQLDQFNFGLLQPTEPRSMLALISAGLWRDGSTIYAVADQFTKDFTSDIPTTGGSALAVLVEIEPSSGTLSYTNGSEFDAALRHEIAFDAYYPQPTGILVGWVKLVAGMSAIMEGVNILPGQIILGAGAGGDDTGLYMNLWW